MTFIEPLWPMALNIAKMARKLSGTVSKPWLGKYTAYCEK